MWLSDTIAQEIVWSDEDLFPIDDVDPVTEYEDEAPWSDADYDQEDWYYMEDAFLDSYWEGLYEM